jgi:hypothetical protein
MVRSEAMRVISLIVAMVEICSLVIGCGGGYLYLLNEWDAASCR